MANNGLSLLSYRLVKIFPISRQVLLWRLAFPMVGEVRNFQARHSDHRERIAGDFVHLAAS